MAVSEPWKRYLEAGMELTEVTRQRAEKLVKDLVKAGDVGVHEAQERIEELLDRSRKTTESVAELVRREVQQQMENLGLVQPVKQATATAKKTAGTAKKAAQKTAKQTAKKTTATAKKATATAKKAAGRS